MSLIRLLSPSRAVLAISSVLAGYCLFRFYAYTAGNQLVVPYLLAAGALLSMADSAWRHIFTAAAEAARNPQAENQATGGLSTAASFCIAAFTTMAGLMCAMTGGYNSFRAAGVMVLLMLARSALFRTTEVISPLLGGLIHGMVFVIGMTAHPSFVEMYHIDEARFPAAFFAAYMIVASVLAQVRDSARPRETPAGEELASETASRLLEVRDDAVDPMVVWFGGAALVVIPLLLAWIMSQRWLSVVILVYLAVTTALKLIPVLAYRTRRDLNTFIQSVYRGGALLNAGSVASLGDYRLREVYDGWLVPLPGEYELAAIAIIAFLTIPAWLMRRTAPID